MKYIASFITALLMILLFACSTQDQDIQLVQSLQASEKEEVILDCRTIPLFDNDTIFDKNTDLDNINFLDYNKLCFDNETYCPPNTICGFITFPDCDAQSDIEVEISAITCNSETLIEIITIDEMGYYEIYIENAGFYFVIPHGVYFFYPYFQYVWCRDENFWCKESGLEYCKKFKKPKHGNHGK